MFPQFKKLNNESGLALFIVLMTAIIIMIFSAGILTETMNEVNYAQQQVDQIASDQLAKGVFWYAYSTGTAGFPMTSYSLQNRTYGMSIASGGITNAITPYTVSVNYDTFQ